MIARSAGVVGIALVLGACIPQVDDPRVFEREIAVARAEWLELCASMCAAEDASPACDDEYLGDPKRCASFDPVAAIDCYVAYRAAAKREVCEPDTRPLQTIVKACDDVYGDCSDAETDGESSGATDANTGTDTGTDTDTGTTGS